jgi:hypothetical protein
LKQDDQIRNYLTERGIEHFKIGVVDTGRQAALRSEDVSR